MLNNTAERWGGLAQALHWLIALAIFAMMVLGWLADSWRLSPTKIELFVWHKSFGIVILLLVSLRLGWRLTQIVPRLPAGTHAWERRLAGASHLLLYVLMFAMPLSGWVINSASDFPLELFWLVPLPDLVPPDEGLQRLAERIHLTGFWLLAGIVALHVAAALRHHFVLRDDVLLRMLPRGGAAPVESAARKTEP